MWSTPPSRASSPLDEPLPDHSSLSKIRSRYGVDTFQRFFERIVELCMEAGLVEGDELYIDATKVEADASIASLRPRLSLAAAQEHVRLVFEEDAALRSNSHRQRRPLRALGRKKREQAPAPRPEKLRSFGA